MKKRKKFETISVRTQVKRSSQKEHSVPIFATSSFVFDNAEEARAVFADEKGGNIYSRYSNPNNDEFIEKLCLMEKTEDGESTATGMAAIFLALTSHLKAGDHIVASRSLFSSTHQIITNILPRWGITHTYRCLSRLSSVACWGCFSTPLWCVSSRSGKTGASR